MTHDEIIAVGTKRFELMNAHNQEEAISELYAKDAVVDSPTAGRLEGRAAILRVDLTWSSAFRDLTTTVEDVIVEGDRAVVIARGSTARIPRRSFLGWRRAVNGSTFRWCGFRKYRTD